MGLHYYDEREVEQAPANSDYSAAAEQVFQNQPHRKGPSAPKQSYTHELLRPQNRPLKCQHKSPIVFGLDVTGSMGRWTKVLYDKLPMLFGQVCAQQYLEDPAISFCGIGDALTDRAPLQVSDFQVGSALDNHINKLYLEGGGGGNERESYELAAWYYARMVKTPGAQLPMMFLLGDEMCYSKVTAAHIKEFCGIDFEDCNTDMIFKELRSHWNLVFLHKPYSDLTPEGDAYCRDVGVAWEALVGPGRVLHLPNEARMVVDVILGAIALHSGARTLEQYIGDMLARGQTEARRAAVRQVLAPLADGLASGVVTVVGVRSAAL